MGFSELGAGVSQGLLLVFLLAGIPLLTSLVVGLIVSVFQAATQIQEQTLSFIPKLVSVCAVLYFLGPWFARELTEYTSGLLAALPETAMLW